MIGSSRAAIRYAKAVLSASIDVTKADTINTDMQLIATTINESRELQVVLNSPVIKSDAKKAALMAIFNKKIDSTSLSLVNLLVENKRLPLLPEVAKQYTFLYNQYKGSQVASVTTAFELTEALEKKILAKTEEITGKKISLESIIDPAIIGGFILRVGDKQFDASILGKMNNLRRTFENNVQA